MNMPPALPCFALLFAAMTSATAAAADIGAEASAPGEPALSIYGGRLTEGDWQEAFAPGTEFIDSDLAVATLARSGERSRPYELEGQMARHSGQQFPWEYNLLGALRWNRLPWSRWLGSSAAVGLGLSYATQVPQAEASVINDESDKLMLYWHLELTLAPAESDWQGTLRLHHRSTAYGLFGQDGGSNAVMLGVRYSFD